MWDQDANWVDRAGWGL